MFDAEILETPQFTNSSFNVNLYPEKGDLVWSDGSYLPNHLHQVRLLLFVRARQRVTETAVGCRLSMHRGQQMTFLDERHHHFLLELLFTFPHPALFVFFVGPLHMDGRRRAQ